jgi:hypothetical protein
MFSLNTLLTNWSLMRWLRLAIGIWIAVQAILLQDALAGLISAFFLFQAATNTGCCGAGGCATPPAQGKQPDSDPVGFEEVKARPNER